MFVNCIVFRLTIPNKACDLFNFVGIMIIKSISTKLMYIPCECPRHSSVIIVHGMDYLLDY